MKLKKCSLVLCLTALICAALGTMSVFAGKSDAISVNGINVKEGQELTAVVSLSSSDMLLSAYDGSVSYNKDYLELKDVSEVKENVTYSKNSSSVRLAQVDAVEGINLSQKTTLMKLTFVVKSADANSTSIDCKMNEMYKLDKEGNKDVQAELTNDVLSVEVKANDSNSANNSGDKSTNTDDDELDINPKTADETPVVTIALYLAAALCFGVGTIAYRKSKKNQIVRY